MSSTNRFGARGYSPVFGGVPNLPSAGAVQGDLSSILNGAIPGFSGLSQNASGYIDDLMGGRLPPSVINEIQDAGAAQAVASGIPGASRDFGSVFGNEVLRNIGTAAETRKQKGFSSLLDLLRSYSGTAALTPGQVQDQGNSRAMYDSAPIPSYAVPYMMDTYKKAAASGGGGSSAQAPITQGWMTSNGRKFSDFAAGTIFPGF